MSVTFNEPHLRPHIPTPGHTLIDAGAYRGAWSIYLAKVYKQVHAIEPQPQHELLAPPANVQVHRWAAADDYRQIELEVHQNRPHFVCAEKMAAGMVSGGEVDRAQVEARPIDSLLPELEAATLLKIDVEGYEVEALTGAAGVIERYRPKLIVECHCLANRRDCESFMQDRGYAVEAVTKPRWPKLCWLIGESG